MSEKNIKDYLYLYLGCEVDVDLEEFKSQYYADAGHLVGKLIGIENEMASVEYFHNHTRNSYFKIARIKPILRQLSDMTEEEKIKVNIKYPREDVTRTLWTVDEIYFLLSKHFDLFSLIEQGIAIDKKTLK